MSSFCPFLSLSATFYRQRDQRGVRQGGVPKLINLSALVNSEEGPARRENGEAGEQQTHWDKWSWV